MQRILREAVRTGIEDIFYAASIIYGDQQTPYRALLQEQSHTSQRQEEQKGRNLGHLLFMTGIAAAIWYTSKP